MKKAICIDFDGTITEDSTFPNIGKELMWVNGILKPEEYDEVSEMLKHDAVHKVDGKFIRSPATHIIKILSNDFHIIIHTCRTGKPQEQMVEWLASKAAVQLHKRHDYSINYNPYCPEAHEKPFADVYLDNRGLRWSKDTFVVSAIDAMIASLPVHTYIPQK